MKIVHLEPKLLMVNRNLIIFSFSVLVSTSVISKEITQKEAFIARELLNAQTQFNPDKVPDRRKNEIIDCYRCCVGFTFKDHTKICEKYNNLNKGKNCRCEEDDKE
jgi:hypothetical protein